jgi:hypothetical protein
MKWFDELLKIMVPDPTDVVTVPTKFELAIVYEHEFYGGTVDGRVILPYQFTSAVNRRACAAMLDSMSGDEIKAILVDLHTYVGGAIVGHEVEYLDVVESRH